jgi:hypothetical protein
MPIRKVWKSKHRPVDGQPDGFHRRDEPNAWQICTDQTLRDNAKWWGEWIEMIMSGIDIPHPGSGMKEVPPAFSGSA